MVSLSIFRSNKTVKLVTSDCFELQIILSHFSMFHHFTDMITTSCQSSGVSEMNLLIWDKEHQSV